MRKNQNLKITPGTKPTETKKNYLPFGFLAQRKIKKNHHADRGKHLKKRYCQKVQREPEDGCFFPQKALKPDILMKNSQ